MDLRLDIYLYISYIIILDNKHKYIVNSFIFFGQIKQLDLPFIFILFSFFFIIGPFWIQRRIIVIFFQLHAFFILALIVEEERTSFHFAVEHSMLPSYFVLLQVLLFLAIIFLFILAHHYSKVRI